MGASVTSAKPSLSTIVMSVIGKFHSTAFICNEISYFNVCNLTYDISIEILAIALHKNNARFLICTVRAA